MALAVAPDQIQPDALTATRIARPERRGIGLVVEAALLRIVDRPDPEGEALDVRHQQPGDGRVAAMKASTASVVEAKLV